MAYKYPRIGKHKLRVGKSSAGLGLYAVNEIPRGDYVVEYYGPLLNEEEADKKSGKYLFKIDRKWTIDGTGRQNTARYINHSCKPNCYVEQDGKRFFIYTRRKIHPGEELSYNYGKEYFEDLIKPHGCRCGMCNGKGLVKKKPKV
ncbi:hypothetical protein CL654_01355 [bacterium]|nr:hypothetical protein [bacterium]|tara:strand:+ start:13488 stop:13922 length:435 start_codon:yes stop_codon:yes gene_type:complete